MSALAKRLEKLEKGLGEQSPALSGEGLAPYEKELKEAGFTDDEIAELQTLSTARPSLIMRACLIIDPLGFAEFEPGRPCKVVLPGGPGFHSTVGEWSEVYSKQDGAMICLEYWHCEQCADRARCKGGENAK